MSFRMLMAAIGVPASTSSAWQGDNWRLRGLLLLVAVTFHVMLLCLIRSNHFVLPDPAASTPWSITARLMPPAPASNSPAQQPLVTTRQIDVARRMMKPAATRRAAAPPAGMALTAPSLSPSATEGRDDIERANDQAAGQQIDGQLDVENLEREAVLLARDRGVTGEMPSDRLGRSLTANEKLTEAVNKAERKNCRNAYAGLGLLAIPFLVENTVTGTGCKW